MNIAGSGSLPGGDYNEGIHISGSGKVKGNTSCTEFSISGSGKVEGDLHCTGKVKISGSGTIEGNVDTVEFSVAGSGKVNGLLRGDKCTVSGSFHAGSVSAGNLHVGGSMKSDGDVSAENAVVRGGISAGGLINAEKLDVEFDSTSDADSIGGSQISIRKKNPTGGFIGKLFGKKESGYFNVNGSIEGDVIYIEYTIAESVVGREVNIGPGCKIKNVSYTDSIKISDDAEVESKNAPL